MADLSVQPVVDVMDVDPSSSSSVPASSAPSLSSPSSAVDSLKRNRDQDITHAGSSIDEAPESALKRARLAATSSSAPVPLSLALVADKGVVVRALTAANAKGYRTARTNVAPVFTRAADARASAYYAEVRCELDASASAAASASAKGKGSSSSSSSTAPVPCWRVGVCAAEVLLSAPADYGARGVTLRARDGRRMQQARASSSPLTAPFSAGAVVSLLLVHLGGTSPVRVLVRVDGGDWAELAADAPFPALHVCASLFYGAQATFVLAPPFAHPIGHVPDAAHVAVAPYADALAQHQHLQHLQQLQQLQQQQLLMQQQQQQAQMPQQSAPLAEGDAMALS